MRYGHFRFRMPFFEFYGFGPRGFGPPWRYPRREDYVRMLEDYKKDLEEELKEVEKELEELRREG